MIGAPSSALRRAASSAAIERGKAYGDSTNSSSRKTARSTTAATGSPVCSWRAAIASPASASSAGTSTRRVMVTTLARLPVL